MKQSQTDIVHGDSVGQTGFDVVFSAVKELFGVAHDSQQRKAGFHSHALIPGAFFAQFDVVGNAVSTAEAPVSQQNSLLVVFLKEIQESIIRTIHRCPNPAADLAEGVEDPTQADTHTPAALIL